jgi:hypothetical protein
MRQSISKARRNSGRRARLQAFDQRIGEALGAAAAAEVRGHALIGLVTAWIAPRLFPLGVTP